MTKLTSLQQHESNSTVMFLKQIQLTTFQRSDIVHIEESPLQFTN
uniref:Uncharacterized protein n=1 Tax=Arundo donax TaxID=35708 RepID=A0A0A9U6I2_ARUDO